MRLDMWPYLLLFLLPAYFAVSRLKPVTLNSQSGWNRSWSLVFVLFILMIGLRHEVGGDWFTYIKVLDTAKTESLAESIIHSDPAFSFLNWASAQSGTGVYSVNIIFAIIFSLGLLVFCRAQPRPWLALVVAVPYLVIVVAMGYSRQGVAIGLICMGLASLDQGRILRFVLLLSFAALFHNSAVILLPLAALVSTNRRFFTLLWLSVSGVFLFVLLLKESVEGFTSGYLVAEYQSSGAAIRVAMNALPAFAFLLLRKRFQLKPVQRNLWTWIALGALAFILILKLSPSSTAVDRMALYLIPLQLFVWSRLPDALGRTGGKNTIWVYAIVAYSAAVLFGWLFFADNSSGWLPYQFYPWVWMWK